MENRFNLTTPNYFEGGGFVLGLQHAALGNALSTAANMAELHARTGIRTAYPELRNTSAMKLIQREDKSNVWAYGCWRGDHNRLCSLSDLLGSIIGACGADAGIGAARLLINPTSIRDLPAINNTIVMTSAELNFKNLASIEADIKEFCSRGNGLVISGAYWTQYSDDNKTGIDYVRRFHMVGRRDELNPPSQRRKRVALHMRAGDYRVWAEGKFFFSQGEVAMLAKTLYRAWPDAVFEVFSNEANINLGDELPWARGVSQGESSDFEMMSCCDVIVGPPSTFATWAAYLGRAKRIVLTRDSYVRLLTEGNPEKHEVIVNRPTFSYVPGVSGPSTDKSLT